MRLRGGPYFEGRRGNPVTEKQWSIIEDIEKASGGRIVFYGIDSHDAYYFIQRFHHIVPPNDDEHSSYFRSEYRYNRRYYKRRGKRSNYRTSRRKYYHSRL